MTILRRAALAAVALSAVVGAVAAPSAFAHDPKGLDAIGLAGDGTELVAFRTDDPEGAETIGPVTGLTGEVELVGIDYRVQNERLYGVGDGGGIYLLDEGSAAAEKVGQLTVALAGTFFGVDFDPAANALRIVSNTGQNLRQPFGDGDAPMGATVIDSPLNRSGQGVFSPTPATGITAAAYINNDLDPDTGTNLIDIDTRDDRLAAQFPANEGTLRGIGNLGELGELAGDTGLDIYSRSTYDDMRDDDAFATVRIGTEFRLLAVDLFDSEFVDRGPFTTDVLDLAIRLDQ